MNILLLFYIVIYLLYYIVICSYDRFKPKDSLKHIMYYYLLGIFHSNYYEEKTKKRLHCYNKRHIDKQLYFIFNCISTSIICVINFISVVVYYTRLEYIV